MTDHHDGSGDSTGAGSNAPSLDCDYCRPLALTLLFSLIMSIVVGLVVIPPLSAIFLKQRDEREFGIVARFRKGYINLLRKALAHPKTTYGIAVAILCLSLFLVPMMGTEFLPALDEGSIAINVVRLPNASLDGAVSVAGLIEKRFLKYVNENLRRIR